MSHVHAHTPHELTEKEGPRPVSRRERIQEFAAVLLLSLATVCTAWSGYQAALWAGVQSQQYALASTERIHAQAQNTKAGQVRIDDLLIFDGWLEAREANNTRLAQNYERRFRPHFVPAFRAWLAEQPFRNLDARPSPLYMPQYRPPGTREAQVLDAHADEHYTAGTEAKENDDRYILSTVFFAAVLFFSGISLRLEWFPLRMTVLGLGTTLLLGGIVFVATQPVTS